MSCTQKAVISPCLPEVGSWKLSFPSYLYSVKTDCFHQLLYSKFFSSNLCPILEVEGKALISLLSVEMLEWGQSHSVLPESSSPQFVFTQVGQNHPYTTHICFLFGCVIPLCKFSIFFFLIPLPLSREEIRTFFFPPKKNQDEECLLPGA